MTAIAADAPAIVTAPYAYQVMIAASLLDDLVRVTCKLNTIRSRIREAEDTVGLEMMDTFQMLRLLVDIQEVLEGRP